MRSFFLLFAISLPFTAFPASLVRRWATVWKTDDPTNRQPDQRRWIHKYTIARLSVARWRQALAFSIRLRRLSAELSLVQNINEILEVLVSLCGSQGFDQVNLELHRAPDIAANKVMESHQPLATSTRAAWTWNWKRIDVTRRDAAPEPHYLILRAPLTDKLGAKIGAITFYCDLANNELIENFDRVCSLFRMELSAALDRLDRTRN